MNFELQVNDKYVMKCLYLSLNNSVIYRALVLFDFVGQWECQTLTNQSFVMMHEVKLWKGEVMDINVTGMDISDQYSDFGAFNTFGWFN